MLGIYILGILTLLKLFNKFYSTTKNYRKAGTGLGLYLSKQIIEAHDGKISVKSEENVQTEFCIELPAARNID